MTVSDWINLIAAILVGGGTLFLGIMAWRSIRETRNIEMAQKRERLLNEILEWATSLANVAFGHEVATIIPTEDPESLRFHSLGNRIFRYQAIEIRNDYIEECAQVFGEELHNAVLAIISCRNNAGENIDKLVGNPRDESCWEALDKAEHELRKQALQLIRLVANIETSDIR